MFGHYAVFRSQPPKQQANTAQDGKDDFGASTENPVQKTAVRVVVTIVRCVIFGHILFLYSVKIGNDFPHSNMLHIGGKCCLGKK